MIQNGAVPDAGSAQHIASRLTEAVLRQMSRNPGLGDMEAAVQQEVRELSPGMGPIGHAVAVARDSQTAAVVILLSLADDDFTLTRGAAKFGLSPRERAVAVRLARGERNKEIAHGLGIATHTARHHVERVLQKLGVQSRHLVARTLTRAVIESGGQPSPR
jgi:DNA-binding CsgD family transcriptional regulator